MDLAAVLRPTLPPERLVEQAKAAEAADASELWLWEDCFLTGGIAATAAAFAATERIVVGIGILPAPVRNAAFAAMELATLARLHSGRLHAGFGHGLAEWMHQVGAKSASQLTLLEEVTVAVRALLRGRPSTQQAATSRQPKRLRAAYAERDRRHGLGRMVERDAPQSEARGPVSTPGLGGCPWLDRSRDVQRCHAAAGCDYGGRAGVRGAAERTVARDLRHQVEHRGALGRPGRLGTSQP